MTHKHAKCKIKVFSLLSFSLLHRSDTDAGKSLICPGCLAPRTQEFSGPTLGFSGSRERPTPLTPLCALEPVYGVN